MFAWSENAHPVAMAIVGVAIEAGALWAFVKGADLLFGRRTQGGLIGTNALRFIAFGYGIMMAGGLIFATGGQPLAVRAVAALGGVVMICGLLVVARRRQLIKALEESARLKAWEELPLCGPDKSQSVRFRPEADMATEAMISMAL
ncbi:hypothetical protein [Dyella japonica]|nr:hypothetical protein [Dyella japonica]